MSRINAAPPKVYLSRSRAVEVRECLDDGQLSTSLGQATYRRGDFLVTQDNGEYRIVKRKLFDLEFMPLGETYDLDEIDALNEMAGEPAPPMVTLQERAAKAEATPAVFNEIGERLEAAAAQDTKKDLAVWALEEHGIDLDQNDNRSDMEAAFEKALRLNWSVQL